MQLMTVPTSSRLPISMAMNLSAAGLIIIGARSLDLSSKEKPIILHPFPFPLPGTFIFDTNISVKYIFLLLQKALLLLLLLVPKISATLCCKEKGRTTPCHDISHQSRISSETCQWQFSMRRKLCNAVTDKHGSTAHCRHNSTPEATASTMRTCSYPFCTSSYHHKLLGSFAILPIQAKQTLQQLYYWHIVTWTCITLWPWQWCHQHLNCH